MKKLVIGVSDCLVSNDPEVSLITYALGSCIAIMIYDAVSRVGGLLHFLLPDSQLDIQRAIHQPFVFADTGIPTLFKTAYAKGAVKNRLQIIVAGGAQIFSEDTFQTGLRNRDAVRHILKRADLKINREITGGRDSRTVGMDISDGRAFIKTFVGSTEPEL
jgi:chemotaxis protein CheD